MVPCSSLRRAATLLILTLSVARTSGYRAKSSLPGPVLHCASSQYNPKKAKIARTITTAPTSQIMLFMALVLYLFSLHTPALASSACRPGPNPAHECDLRGDDRKECSISGYQTDRLGNGSSQRGRHVWTRSRCGTFTGSLTNGTASQLPGAAKKLDRFSHRLCSLGNLSDAIGSDRLRPE